MVQKDWTQSIDLLLLLVVVPAHIGRGTVEFLLVVPLLIYFWLALLEPLHDYPRLPASMGRARVSFLARFLLLFIIITAAVILPTLQNVLLRISDPPDSSGYTDAYARMHDGAVQMEAALSRLREGENPYVVDYSNTPLRFYTLNGLEKSANPASSYFVYLPGYLLFSYPVFAFLDQMQLFYDQRLIYLAFYILLVLVLPTLVEQPASKLALLAAVGLNPLVAGPVKIGMNDIVVLTMLTLVGLALLRNRMLVSAILFGLACTLKQSAWFVGPFYLLLLHSLIQPKGRYRKLAALLSVTSFVFLAIVFPFVLWNPFAFFVDVIAYPAGAAPTTYPIRGSTIGELLVGSGIVASPLSPFPFGILQLIFGVPTLLFLLNHQRQHNHTSAMFLASGLFIFTLGFFSRFFQSNYVGFVLSLIAIGVILNRDEARQTQLD